MRILITNDDGISAPGLAVLEQIAQAVAGPDGEVWTVAPAFEQSGVGHCISYTRPFMLSQLSERRFAAEGSPADCVLAGLHVVMKDALPDLVLSGVNRGSNSAENALYSGTLGGAMEAALQGIPAIALSQYFGPQNANIENPFEAAAHHGAELIRAILETQPSEAADYRLFYNVNFPPIPAAAVKGTVAEAVIGRPFLLVHQDVVGLGGLLELAVRVRVIGVAIRMVLHRYPAIRLLDVLLIGTLADAEYFVIIAL